MQVTKISRPIASPAIEVRRVRIGRGVPGVGREVGRKGRSKSK